MDKKLCDTCWACLPQEARDKMRKDIAHSLDGEYYKGWHSALTNYFGQYNLTSDTEPSELIYADRQKTRDFIGELYENARKSDSEGELQAYQMAINYLEDLFGDKCLPDKESSVQGEPKFKVGDRMYIKHLNKVGTIDIVQGYNEEEDGIFYHLKVEPKGVATAREEYLEPYPEPETKMTEERYQYLNSLSIEEYDKETSSAEQTAFCDYQQKYHPDEVVYWQTHSNDTPETKDNMEEKELNLCELLKNCIGEEFWSPMFDVVKLSRIDLDDNKPLFFNFKGGVIYTHANGVMYENTLPIIFPSRALYEKYPLDAKKSWQVWASERKPKVKLHVSYEIIQGCLHGCGDFPILEFYTDKEAQQAAEAVKNTLIKFHENFSAQNLDIPK